MAQCQYCSAPLPSNSIICEYCGVRNDIEVEAKNVGSKLPKSKRTCPDCLVYLDSIDIGKNSRFIIEKCERCYGLFFDNQELEKLLESTVGKTYWIDRRKLHSLLQHPLHKDEVLYRKCPVCEKYMHRKNYMKRSGVIMDICYEHGTWLDAGELKQLEDWIKLGGKEDSQAKMEQEEIQKKYVNRKPWKERTNKSFKESSMTEEILDIMGMLLRIY